MRSHAQDLCHVPATEDSSTATVSYLNIGGIVVIIRTDAHTSR